MKGLSILVIQEFCALCNKTYAVWRVHKVIFEDNPCKRELELSAAGKTLEHFSIISQESLLHQISKLHDPAMQQGQANLSIDYILRFGAWEAPVEAKLKELRSRLDELAQKIRPARHKALSHNDLEAILNGLTLGSFPDGADDDYFRALQEFVDVIHDNVIGGPSTFNDDASVDAASFLACLAK